MAKFHRRRRRRRVRRIAFFRSPRLFSRSRFRRRNRGQRSGGSLLRGRIFGVPVKMVALLLLAFLFWKPLKAILAKFRK